MWCNVTVTVYCRFYRKFFGIWYRAENFLRYATARFIFDKFRNPTFLLTTNDKYRRVVIISRFGLMINTVHSHRILYTISWFPGGENVFVLC